MPQRVRTEQPRDTGSQPTAPALADPFGLLQWQRAWIDAMKPLTLNSPWSGDVTQWIRAWGEVVGQVGLLNVNYSGSRDVQAERRITGRYSYGSQLGRMLEVLAPYVKRHEKEFTDAAGALAVKDLLTMADEIGQLKEASVEDLVDQVRQWQKDGSLADKLPRLIARLQEMQASLPRPK